MKRLLSVFLFLCLGSTLFAQHAASMLPMMEATHVASSNGSWDDESTWKNGEVPSAGAKVFIPPSVVVTLADTTTPALDWVLVGGELNVDPASNNTVTVHTIETMDMSLFQIGTKASPVTGSCRFIFTGGDFHSFDSVNHRGRGLMTHGVVEIYGSEMAHACLFESAEAGSSSVQLNEPAYGWEVGDRVLVPGTHLLNGWETGYKNRYEDEWRTITSIDGTSIELDSPLEYTHGDNVPDVHLINLTRTVEFTSSSKTNRGHVMFMSPDVDCCFAAFRDLGRTDKHLDVTDPEITGDNTNPRARYSLHFHRTGAPSHMNGARFDSEGNGKVVSNVTGCVVEGSPGWGFVNHVSNVVFEKCVAVDCYGAGFATEEGDEAGAFIECIAAHCLGDAHYGSLAGSNNADNTKGNTFLADFGKGGDGFWLQAPLVEVLGCTTYGCSSAGYNIFEFEFSIGGGHGVIADYLDWDVTIEDSRLPSPIENTDEWFAQFGYGRPAKGKNGELLTRNIPIQSFVGNRAVACLQGLQRWSTNKYSHEVPAKITDFEAYEYRRTAVNLEYCRFSKLRNILVSNGGHRNSLGMNARGGFLNLDGFTMVGVESGISLPTSGFSRISNGSIDASRYCITMPGPEGDNTTLVRNCQLAGGEGDVLASSNIKNGEWPHLTLFSIGRPIVVDAGRLQLNGKTGVLTLDDGVYEAVREDGKQYRFAVDAQ